MRSLKPAGIHAVRSVRIVYFNTLVEYTKGQVFCSPHVHYWKLQGVTETVISTT